MRAVTDMYKRSYMGRRYEHYWRTDLVCESIKDILNPISVVDVGCATGDFVKRFNGMGIPAKGIEGSEHCLTFLECAPGDIVIQDLREPFKLADNFDLAICFEVAEHIEPEYAHIFVQNLVGLSDRLLLSIAGPGQLGHGHVNLQPISYWKSLFRKHGYVWNRDIPRAFKKRWKHWRNKPGIIAYYKNVVFFER